MKIAVFGAGGVGAYFGGRLARSGAEVHLIARGSHLEALRRDGLRVRSVLGDFEIRLPATDAPGEIGPSDYVLFCVKSYDTEQAAAQLGPLIRDQTAVISLQNGIDNEEKIAEQVGWEHVIGGVAYIFSRVAEPGGIEHAGGPSNIVFGEMNGSVSERGRRFADQCRRAEIDVTLSDDIRSVLWTKFSFISALSGTTAATQLPIGEIRTVPESRALFRRLVEEVRALAAAEGVDLPQELVEQQLELVDSLEAEGRSSLYHDLNQGRRMELEALQGAAVHRGKKRGLDLCASETVYALLRPWAERNERPG